MIVSRHSHRIGSAEAANRSQLELLSLSLAQLHRLSHCVRVRACHLLSFLVRDVFDHAFNVFGERSLRIDWSRFIVTNCVSNLNYLMRIYRLTEQELNSHNPFFAQTPDEARHRLIKAELLRTYKLHVAVSNPRAYLRKLSTAVLSRILRSSDFKSETVRTLTREVLTTFVSCIAQPRTAGDSAQPSHGSIGSAPAVLLLTAALMLDSLSDLSSFHELRGPVLGQRRHCEGVEDDAGGPGWRWSC